MSPRDHLAAAITSAAALPAETRPAWPKDAPAPELVAALLAQRCSEIETAISKGYVRAKSMKGRPEKAAPKVVAP